MLDKFAPLLTELGYVSFESPNYNSSFFIYFNEDTEHRIVFSDANRNVSVGMGNKYKYIHEYEPLFYSYELFYDKYYQRLLNQVRLLKLNKIKDVCKR